MQAKDALSVSQVTRRIKEALEEGVGRVWVEGELSSLKAHASGHWYFSLKDEHATLSAAMFRGRNRSVRFKRFTHVLRLG